MVRLLSRNRVSDYVRIEGLQKLTGVAAHDWDIYILKELIDNALDAEEAYGHEIPQIITEMRYDGLGLTVSVSNSMQFPMLAIDRIFDFDLSTSVKDLYSVPTRGAQGNALKTILGIPYALQYFYFANYSPQLKPIFIRSGGLEAELVLEVDEIEQTIRPHIVTSSTTSTSYEGTMVSVNLFKFKQQQPRTLEYLIEFARAFSLWNPHADFEFHFVIDGQPSSFETKGDPDWRTKYDMHRPAPLLWYSYPEFRDLIHALLLDAHRRAETEPTIADAAELFGIDASAFGSEIDSTTQLRTLVDSVSLNTNKLHQLYSQLRRIAKSLPVPSLGQIGSEKLRQRLQPNPNSNGFFFYRCFATEADIESPFVLEVALCSNSFRREVLTGINHTPTYRDPFLGKLLTPLDTNDSCRGLEKLLDYYNISSDTEVTVSIHILSPRVVYENYGKSAIDHEPFKDTLCKLIAELVVEFHAATKGLDLMTYLTQTAYELLPSAITALSSHGFLRTQLLATLKKHLRRLDDDILTKALSQPEADAHLLMAIMGYIRENPVVGLLSPHHGQIALPQHPTDVVSVGIYSNDISALLAAFQARALLVTHRPDLEELLLSLKIPLLYDVALLRGGNDLSAALDALARQISLSSNSGYSPFGLEQASTSIWVVRDASIEGMMFVASVREHLRNNGIDESTVFDLGLHPDDEAMRDAFIEHGRTYPLTSLVEPLNGLDGEARYYLQDHAYAMLDTLAPNDFFKWFDRRLSALGFAHKLAPSPSVLVHEASSRVKDGFYSVVSLAVFNQLGLEVLMSDLADRWISETPTWEEDLPHIVNRTLSDQPHLSWRLAMNKVVDQQLKRYLTPLKMNEIQTRIDECRNTLE